jgi:hypothetical protein
MIPGRNACYNGWNLEYRGVLVSGYYGHKAASTYICLDEKPEIVDTCYSVVILVRRTF